MDTTARLPTELLALAAGGRDDHADLSGYLDSLVASLRQAVPGYAGLQLSIVHSSHPVVLTAMLPTLTGRPAVTSLRLSLPTLDGSGTSGTVVVWSTEAGSLVDLAAYVDPTQESDGSSTSASSTQASSAHPSSAPVGLPGVQHDVDLPLPAGAVSGTTGMEEAAAINRAAGVLMARGHGQAATAHDDLRDGAAAAGVSTHLWALEVLQTMIERA